MRILVLTFGLLALLVVGSPAGAQNVPAHNHIAITGVGSGGNQILPARRRSFLLIINNASAVVKCTLDDTNATATNGIRLNAVSNAGASVMFDTAVPRGSLRCYSATDGSTIDITEGQ